jgi:hypothetical protein
MFVLCRPVQVEAYATGWSLHLRGPTTYLNKITKRPVWGGQGPYKDSRASDDIDEVSSWKLLKEAWWPRAA